MSLAGLTSVHTVDVYHPTITSDTKGGWTTAYSISNNDAKCRIRPLSAKEGRLYGQHLEIVTHRIYSTTRLAYPQDIVAYGDRAFSAIGVYNTDELNRLWVCDCVELQGDAIPELPTTTTTATSTTTTTTSTTTTTTTT